MDVQTISLPGIITGGLNTWHDPEKTIPVMVKLKQVVMPYIELIQDKSTTNRFPSCFKGYADMNPHLLSEHDHQIILGKIEAR